MNSTDPHVITDLTALRQAVGESNPGIDIKVHDKLDRFAVDFIARSPFLVLSTCDASGNLDASPKGDAPGFVEVVDDTTLLIPDRPGNKLIFGHQNILANPKVGLLFLIPGTPETVRVNGTAELTTDPALISALAARGKPAVLVMRVQVEEVFFHCAKAFVRSGLWKPDQWADRYKVSFGEMFREWTGAGEDAVKSVDEAIENDIRDNL
jgi:PPOX class probable FMN-dependent enzyme